MEFFGFVKTFSSRGENSELLEKMQSALLQKQSRNACVLKTFVDDLSGFVACSPGTGNPGTCTDIASVDGPALFFLDGHVLDVNGSAPSGEKKAAETVSALFLNDKEELLSGLNGRFNIVFWNKATKTLHLATDRYGFKQVFLHQGKNIFLFSTDLDTLLASGLIAKDLEESAIYDFLNYQFVLRNKTFFKDITLLPAGICIKKNRRSQTLIQHWQYPSSGEKKKGRLPDLIAEGGYLIEKSVQKHLAACRDKKVAVTLSGGLDSRIISGFVTKGRPDTGLFHGRWHGYEAEYARRAAEVMGAAFIEVDLSNPDWSALLDSCFPLTDGHLSCHQFWLMDVVTAIVGRGFEHCFDGVAMDVIFQPHMLTMTSAEAGSLSEKVEALLQIYPLIAGSYARKYYSSEFADRNEEVCRNDIAEHLSSFDCSKLLETSQYFYWTGRGRRYIWPMIHLNSGLIQYACPGLDNQVFDFGTALPVDLRRDGFLYRKIIDSCFPRLAAVPCARTKLPVTRDPSPLHKKFSKQVSLLKHATSRALRGRIDFLPEADYNHAFRKKTSFRHAFLNIMADERTYQRKFFSRSGIENLAADIDRGKNLFSLMEAITTVEMFFRRYID